MDLLVKLVLVVFVVAGFWYAFQPRYAFVVRINHGTPRVTKGTVTPAFLQDIAQTCLEMRVRRGWIGGVRRGRRVALVFARGIPPQCQQRLRNVWLVQG